MLSLLPVFFSNCTASSLTGCSTTCATSTLSSAACAEDKASAAVDRQTIKNDFMEALPSGSSRGEGGYQSDKSPAIWNGRAAEEKRASVRHAAFGGKGIEPPVTEHMRGIGERAENFGEGVMAYIEPASIGAEGRHNRLLAVRHEAAAADGAPTLRHPRHRMQMPGDL